MSKLAPFVAGTAGLAIIPALALLTLVGFTGSPAGCLTTTAAMTIKTDAPVPAAARPWIAAAHTECPQLPEAWLAAVIAQESDFRPDASADDVNGGTRGLFQLNAAAWQATYRAAWSADLDHDGIRDIDDPLIHARVAGRYLCQRLARVHVILMAHPDWVSAQELSDLDALALVHNGGEATLGNFPAIGATSLNYLERVRAHITAWSASGGAGDSTACAQSGPAATLVLPVGTPASVVQAVRTALAYVGLRSGWHNRCDRLACRAYGYASSGYASATVHWYAMLAAGRAHPGDRCPPVGAFAFWATSSVEGHVALVVANDGTCTPGGIKLVSNDVGDRAAGANGGVYLVTLAQIESGWVSPTSYRGWTDPLCAGTLLPAETRHPAP